MASQKEVQKRLKQRAEDDLRSVLGTPQGRRFLWRLLTQAGVYSSSYAASATDTAFNEGRRSVGLTLMAETQRVAPELYTKALREELDGQELLAAEVRALEEAQAKDEPE